MAETTRDAFHHGRFWLVQPSGGHRAGMDAMVLAAAVPGKFAGRVADLGAGAGAAGLAVASRCPGATVALVERNALMVECAAQGLALEENAILAKRVSVLRADVTLAGSKRRAAGLEDRAFDFVIMNPPFNRSADRPSPDDLRCDAHVMSQDMFEAWLKTAAAIVKPGGGLAMIFRPRSLLPVLAALEGRFGGLELLPVHPRADAAAGRIVLRGWHGSKAGLTLHPPFVMHEPGEKKFSERAEAVCNGRQGLFGD